MNYYQDFGACRCVLYDCARMPTLTPRLVLNFTPTPTLTLKPLFHSHLHLYWHSHARLARASSCVTFPVTYPFHNHACAWHLGSQYERVNPTFAHSCSHLMYTLPRNHACMSTLVHYPYMPITPSNSCILHPARRRTQLKGGRARMSIVQISPRTLSPTLSCNKAGLDWLLPIGSPSRSVNSDHESLN